MKNLQMPTLFNKTVLVILISLCYTSTVLGQYEKYSMIEVYDNEQCNSQTYAIFKYQTNTCIKISSSASMKYSNDGNGLRVDSYNDHYCGNSVYTMDSYDPHGTGCIPMNSDWITNRYNFIKFYATDDESLLAPIKDYYFYERHATESCSDNSVIGRSIIHPTHFGCTLSENLYTYYVQLAPTSDGFKFIPTDFICFESSSPETHTTSCPGSWFMAYAMRTPPLNLRPSSTITYNFKNITIPYLLSDYPVGLTGPSYSVTLGGVSTGYTCTSAGCIIPSPSYGTTITSIKIQPNYNYRGFSPEFYSQTISFTIPNPPTVNSVSTVSKTSTLLTIQYSLANSIGSGTTFVVKVNGTVISSCSSTSQQCSLTGLYPGSIQTISVQAITDSVATSAFSLSDTLLPMIQQVTLDSLVFDKTSLTVTYSPNGGAPSIQPTFTVKCNGVANPSCTDTTSKTCTCNTQTGYVFDSTNVVTIVTKSEGYTSTFTKSLYVGDGVNDITVDQSGIKTKSIQLNYSTIGGDLAYPITLALSQVGGGSQPICQASTFTSQCLINNLLPNTSYTFTITADNNGFTFSKNFTYQTYPTLSLSLFSISVVTTSTITVQYQLENGAPGNTNVQIKLVEDPAINCVENGGSSIPSCTFSSLNADTAYNVKAIFTNDGFSIEPPVKQVHTYPSLSNLEASLTDSKDSLNISFSSLGGLPTVTTSYRISVNGQLICDTQTNGGLLYCVYQYGTSYPSQQLLNINIVASNDGTLQKTVPYTTYKVPTTIINSFTSGINWINVTWIEMDGGRSNSTFYETFISYSNGPWVSKCTSSSSSGYYCLFDNLLANQSYNYQIIATNTFFNPVYVNNNATTDTETNGTCLDNCNGNGICNLGGCECIADLWTGPQCQINLNITNNNSSSINYIPIPTGFTFNNVIPSLTVAASNYSYQIHIVKLVEKNGVDNSPVQTIDLQSLGSVWQLNGSTYKASVDDNGDSIFITVQFNNISSYNDNLNRSFAGLNYVLPSGSIEYNVYVEGWKFASSNNYFEIHTTIKNPTICTTNNNVSPTANFTSDNNLLSTLVIGDIDDSSELLLQGRLANAVVLDTIPSNITYHLDSSSTNGVQTTIIATIPSFTHSLSIQPSFHLIAANITSSCETPSTTTSTPTTSIPTTTTTTGDGVVSSSSTISISIFGIVFGLLVIMM